jgi:hypothetical protein
MGYFKLLNKLFPASPDAILKKATDAEAAYARMAHVNVVINDLSDIAKYEVDLSSTYEVPINTNKGIIDITNLSLGPIPGPGFDSNLIIVLVNNPVLNIANRDNIYLQVTAYYNPAVDDEFVPYVLASGFTNGLNIKVYNASAFLAGPNQAEGAFYLYYEIKTLA